MHPIQSIFTDLMELKIIVWMTPAPKSLPVPHQRTLKSLSLQTVSETPWSGRYSEAGVVVKIASPDDCLCVWNGGAALQVHCEGGSPWPLVLVCIFESVRSIFAFFLLLCVVHVCLFPCLRPCLTMCCLFAPVYIYCRVHGCKADHSREQSVFIEFFNILPQGTASALCTFSLFFFLLSLWVFNPLSDILKAANVCPPSTNHKKIHF